MRNEGGSGILIWGCGGRLASAGTESMGMAATRSAVEAGPTRAGWVESRSPGCIAPSFSNSGTESGNSCGLFSDRNLPPSRTKIAPWQGFRENGFASRKMLWSSGKNPSNSSRSSSCSTSAGRVLLRKNPTTARPLSLFFLSMVSANWLCSSSESK